MESATIIENAPKLEEISSKVTEAKFIEKNAPKFYFLGYKIDTVTFYTHMFGLILSIYLWRLVGLHKTNCKLMNTYFYIMIAFWLMQIEGNKNEGVAHITIEEQYYEDIIKLGMIMFGTSIVLTVFIYRMKYVKYDPANLVILGIINLCFIVSILWINFANLAIEFRKYKNFSLVFYTMGLVFMVALILKIMACEQIKK